MNYNKIHSFDYVIAFVITPIIFYIIGYKYCVIGDIIFGARTILYVCAMCDTKHLRYVMTILS